MTYSPNSRSSSVSGVRPVHRPFTVTAAFAGDDLTTIVPDVRVGAAAGVGFGLVAAAVFEADFAGAVFVGAAGGGFTFGVDETGADVDTAGGALCGGSVDVFGTVVRPGTGVTGVSLNARLWPDVPGVVNGALGFASPDAGAGAGAVF
jgi:hypothetical protein